MHSSGVEGPRDVGVVIVAAGSSSRMLGTDKVWADLAGEPIIARTLQAFERCAEVGRIVVVCADGQEGRIVELGAAIGLVKLQEVCPGGETRQESVRFGLLRLGECELVAVHDCARPLVSQTIIQRGLALARERGSALCSVRAKNTIKVVEGGRVLATPQRESLWEAQTPQVFRYTELLSAHVAAAQSGAAFTDDAALMEATGRDVWVYEGSYRNLKVTTPEDLLVARALWEGEV